MLNSKDGNNLKNRLSKLMLWVLFVLLILSIGRTVSKIRSINQRIEDDREEVAKLEAEQEALQKQLEEVESDYYIEKQIRDKLGYSKEGEVVLVLPADELLLEIAPKAPVQEEIQIVPNWQKWLKLFGVD